MAVQRKNRGHNQGKTSQQSTSSSSRVNESIECSIGCESLNESGKTLQSCGLTLSVHPIWPDFGLLQGELFFECTLFLYSVLALFLQYLNLYKSLWWLPKSFWHYSMKLHNINPYFLSCVGLLLGLRVTKCFWSTISELFNNISEGRSPSLQKILKIVQYILIKIPMTTMILTSFLFSFTRIVREFPYNSVIYFFFPPFLYILLFHRELIHRINRLYCTIISVIKKKCPLSEIKAVILEDDPGWLDIENVAHMCSNESNQVREEVDLLIKDFFLRIKRCLFAGCSTAFLSIVLPLSFVPYKTSNGLPQKVLINDSWEIQMGIIVLCTAFTHYVTYLFPITHLDLMYRSAMHLGSWKEESSLSSTSNTQSSIAKKIPIIQSVSPYANLWSPSSPPYPEGTVVETENGKKFRAIPLTNKIRTVSAIPDHLYHSTFTYWCSHPLALINILCIAEALLIIVQFWLLVLTLEWQHIFTLVFLMFANYLLLGKLFKDRVIISRIYDPSREDIALIQQVQSESIRRTNHRVHIE